MEASKDLASEKRDYAINSAIVITAGVRAFGVLANVLMYALILKGD